jgi:hypothetical protein
MIHTAMNSMRHTAGCLMCGKVHAYVSRRTGRRGADEIMPSARGNVKRNIFGQHVNEVRYRRPWLLHCRHLFIIHIIQFNSS